MSDRRPPEFLVIGGMKCGTTALHRYLGAHPQIATTDPKECNFFFGEEPGGSGNWWRGLDWYLDRFPTDPPIRGEASPGYTSPDHPRVAERIAAVAPDVTLLYVTRDPVARAVSQYRHHRRDGDEQRPIGAALLDPDSQYIARSRHHERLRPFLERFPPERIGVLAHEDLLHRRRPTLQAVFRFLGVDDGFWSSAYTRRWNTATQAQPAPAAVRDRLRDAVGDVDAALQQAPVTFLRPRVAVTRHG